MIINLKTKVIHDDSPGENCNTDDLKETHREDVPAFSGVQEYLTRGYRLCKYCFPDKEHR